MTPELKAACEALERKLSLSAFRRGTSAFRYGLVPRGVSDHLPIKAKISLSEDEISLLSWNMLADVHLYNNFKNITGTALLLEAFAREKGTLNIYTGKMDYFFSELAQFLFNQKDGNRVIVNDTLLRDFIQIKNAPSCLAHSPIPEKKQENISRVEDGRHQWVDLLLNHAHPQAHEFKLAIRHSVELIYHMREKNKSEPEEEAGALRWESRFKCLIENKALLSEILNMDLICLQECTDPEDIKALFDKEKQMGILTHHKDNINDYCVLMFDENKFECLGSDFFLLEGTKPCISAKLKYKSTGEVIIVSSIHHPGGKKNELEKIMISVNNLRGEESRLPYIIAGDYNHEQAFFREAEEKMDLHLMYPTKPTMAGNDYKHVNCPIDALMTNLDADKIKQVEVVREGSTSAPADMSISVVFEEDAYRPYLHVGPGFFNRVKNPEKAECPETLDLSHPSLAPRGDL